MLTNMFLVMGLMLIADVCSRRITLRATHLGAVATCDVDHGRTNTVFVAFQWSWMGGFSCELSTEQFHKDIPAASSKPKTISSLWGNLIQRTRSQRTNHGDYQSVAGNDTPPVSRSTSSYIPAVSSKPKTISNIPAVNSKPKTISIAVEQMNVIVSWHNSNVYIALGKDGGPVWLEEDKLMTSVQVEVFVDNGDSVSVDASSIVRTQLTMEENVYIVLRGDEKVDYFCRTIVDITNKFNFSIQRTADVRRKCDHTKSIQQKDQQHRGFVHLFNFHYEKDVVVLLIKPDGKNAVPVNHALHRTPEVLKLLRRQKELTQALDDYRVNPSLEFREDQFDRVALKKQLDKIENKLTNGLH
eukprot:CAMPEP_0113845174 /NCGR_PEP_ID=MMETSP0372-20130328/615_1 /TAXON_ID=340204 /ORGANISM="Lankesteria abbotti" /LENGTH=355 /DNA_ID=CAMNT_0000814197 /DNA_START=41 /DNA_END=1108 /DNA_ORIENTATION=- /assembly_acc=CAM_ASM_000359